ncbi:receptor-type tyrosine-protein phosphatase delta-like isoform X2 [Penaeus japonicus]|nr:receptor-type tyrosine-protein phosphatase delta-like isoform X2 [Penaeus japonicus]
MVTWKATPKDSSYNVTVKCEKIKKAMEECGCKKCKEFHRTTTDSSFSFETRPNTLYFIEVVDLQTGLAGNVSNRTQPAAVHLPNVTIESKENSVDLQWNVNCPYTVPGNYSIFFNETTIVPKKTDCSYKLGIQELSPYKNYTYRLQYFSEKCSSKDCPEETSVPSSSIDKTATSDPSSASCLCKTNRFMTQAAAPSKPRNIEVHGPPFDKPGRSSKIAEIKWKVPEFINGKLSNYLISIHQNGKKVTIGPQEVNKESFKTNLLPETSYTICVKAKNEIPDAYGPEECKKIDTKSGKPFFLGRPWYVPESETPLHDRHFIMINSSTFDESNGKIEFLEVLLGEEEEQLEMIKRLVPTNDPYLFKFENLKSGTRYLFAIRIFTSENNTQSDPYVFLTADAPVSGIMIAFITIVVMLALLLVALFVYTRLFSSIKASTSMELPLVVTYPPDVATERRIIVSNLVDSVTELHKDGGQQLICEYNELKTISPMKSTIHASLDINDYKNRYINILPFDETRVVLNEYRGIPGSDYINASYIHGYSKPKEFIASQGPKEELKDDFWRMIWEKNVHVIVMVTQCVEANKEKCCMYWPSPSNVQGWRLGFSKLHVRTVLEVNHQPGGYVTRKFELSKGTRTRIIQHFHYVSWPDMGCPQTPDQLIQFVKVVRAAVPHESSHTLIHCSAGVGRTGTFIALNNLIDEMDAEASVDVFHCVYRMRHHRANMVQTQSQYSFVYKCILKHYLDSIGESDKFCLADTEPSSLNVNLSAIQDNPYFMQDEYREDEGLIPFTDDEEEEEDEKKKKGDKDKAKTDEEELHEDETSVLINNQHDDNVKANGVIKTDGKNNEDIEEDADKKENEKNEEKDVIIG